jgi:hypothetical protein
MHFTPTYSSWLTFHFPVASSIDAASSSSSLAVPDDESVRMMFSFERHSTP